MKIKADRKKLESLIARYIGKDGTTRVIGMNVVAGLINEDGDKYAVTFDGNLVEFRNDGEKTTELPEVARLLMYQINHGVIPEQVEFEI